MSKLKLDLHDIYNKGDKIDAALENTLREAEEKGALRVNCKS